MPASRYFGVVWSKQAKAWTARLRDDDVIFGLGNYINEEDAAVAYDSAAQYLGGYRRRRNFPERDIPSLSPDEIRRTAKEKRRTERQCKSAYRGVVPCDGKYLAKINRGKQIDCGKWATPEEAAEARDAAIRWFGLEPCEVLNFPSSCILGCPPEVLKKHAGLLYPRKTYGIKTCPKCSGRVEKDRFGISTCKACKEEFYADKKSRLDNRPERLKINQERYWKKIKSDPIIDKQVKLRICANASKYRAIKRGNGGMYTPQEFIDVCERAGNKCVCCGSVGFKLTADHVVPVSKGGSNYISNIQPLCPSCNSRKHDKIIDYRPWTMDSDEIGLDAA